MELGPSSADEAGVAYVRHSRPGQEEDDEQDKGQVPRVDCVRDCCQGRSDKATWREALLAPRAIDQRQGGWYREDGLHGGGGSATEEENKVVGAGEGLWREYQQPMHSIGAGCCGRESSGALDKRGRYIIHLMPPAD